MARSSIKTVNFEPGVQVVFQGQRCVITKIINTKEALVRLMDTEKEEIAVYSQLSPIYLGQEESKKDIEALPQSGWKEAGRRYEIIRPLLENPARTRKDVGKIARDNNATIATLYRWISRYEESGLLTSLMPYGRADKKSARINERADKIIKETVEQTFLTSQRKTKQTVYRLIRKRCSEEGIKPPGRSTVYRRLTEISHHVVVGKRYGRKSMEKLTPIQGHFPEVSAPLAVVQLDHTPLDIILVDDQYRHPIGRPWITLAVDIFSRMVVGFYISFDPPGFLSVGLCLAHAALLKDNWLAKHNIEGEWPCWGLPDTIHVDNAREFRGNSLAMSCQEYGINIEWRPVARPHFGGHVERLLGTFAKEIHTLPGTTFSNIGERGEYKSEQEASLTLDELEKWLTLFIVNVYHQRVHSELGMSPIAKYRLGIIGDKFSPGRGLPPKIVDEERLRLDFMPVVKRTIQRYGVALDGVHYYHDVLRPWMHAKDPSHPRTQRSFVFRRDPRDISVIWFYDPELEKYFSIPYRDTSFPAVSIWEFREAKRQAVQGAGKQVDERAIFAAYDRMVEIEENAKRSTKSIRRNQQRKKKHLAEALSPYQNEIKTSHESTPIALPDIQPFDVLDDLT